jgi:hypothetical protein
MSIVVSGADGRVTVLRNGIVIGSAPATFATPIDRPAAYALQSADGGKGQWLRLPLPGQDIATPTAAEAGEHVTVDPAFERDVRASLMPGTVVLLTPDSMASLAPAPIPVIESDRGSDDTK